MRDARFILPGVRAALDGKAPADHSHSLDDVTGLSTALDGKAAIIHSHALADLPVANLGESDPAKLVRADDPRLSAGSGAGGLAAQRNLVVNGCARVSHRPAAPLAATWQPGEVDLWRVRADGSPSAGTVKRATGVFTLSPSGAACLVQGATLGSGGAIHWRLRLEAADALRLRHSSAVLSARAYHDCGRDVGWTLTLAHAGAPDSFSSVSTIATTTITVPHDSNTDLVLAVPDMGACETGLQITVTAACGAVSGRWFYLGAVQLEAGSTATDFDLRPSALETALVHRQLRPIATAFGRANSGTNIQLTVNHPGMRAAPAYQVTGALTITDMVTANYTQASAGIGSIHERTADGGRFDVSGFSGLTSGTPVVLTSLGGRLLASAEL
ncbi:hypothetical protein [Oleisolibacter albus]|uniref:hypothetical protein n=1 Tax=Oleisolibacter albus TaxID=2171757 RepID=UPI000DF4ABEB|nr:hypothetical protein [Oleisolibacter albus]